MSGKKPSLGRGLAELSPLLARRAGMPDVEKPQILVGDRLASLPVDLLRRGEEDAAADLGPANRGGKRPCLKTPGHQQATLECPLPPRNPTATEPQLLNPGARRSGPAQ